MYLGYYFPAARLAPCLLPASLPLSSLVLSSFLCIEDVSFSLCKWLTCAVTAMRSLPGHPAFFSLRFEDDRLPSAPGDGRCEPRPLSSPPLFASRLLFLLPALPRPPAGPVADSSLRDVGLRGRFAPSCSPSQADPFLCLLLSRVWAAWTCRPTGLSG